MKSKNKVNIYITIHRMVDSSSSSLSVANGIRWARRMHDVATARCLWLLFVGVLIIGFTGAIESNITYALLPYITSAFAAHSRLSTVLIISNITACVVKPIGSKVADVLGRLEALLISLTCSIVAYIMLGNAGNINIYLFSQIFYTIGSSSSLIIVQLIVADNSSLTNRVVLAILPSLPYLVSGWIGPPIAEHILDSSNWRWGLIMWSFILPAAASILLTALIILRIRATKKTPNHEVIKNDNTIFQRFLKASAQLDLVGLFLLGASLSCTLVPFTLGNYEGSYFYSAQFLVPLIIGILLGLVFVWYDVKIAAFPILRFKTATNRTVVAAIGASAGYFLVFYVFDLYLTSYYLVTRALSVTAAGDINNIFTFGSTGAGLFGGLWIKYFGDRARKKIAGSEAVEDVKFAGDQAARKSVRLWCATGPTIYLIGILCFGISICTKAPIPLIILSMTAVSIGAGFVSTPLQAAAQACVPDYEVGSVTALVLTGAMLGGSVGSAVSGAIWTSALPHYLRKYLPDESQDIASEVAADLVVATSYPEGTVIRTAINDAYQSATATLCFVAMGCATVVWVICLFVRPDKDYYRDKRDAQQIVEEEEDTP